MIAELVEKEWDVIVIGTGMGGGVVGRRLAENGLSVLFLERGPAGIRAEQQGLNADITDPVARQVRGYWPSPMDAKIDGRSSRFFGPTGAGLGGTSVFYASALERPEPHDLDDSPERPHPTGGWAAGYDAFEPYFNQAEKQFFVCGEQDPLAKNTAINLVDGPKPSVSDAAMISGLRKRGLHPYQAHLGVRFLPDCQHCFGSKCPKNCKMDSRSAGVEPALATGNAALIDQCEVKTFAGTSENITHITALRKNVELRFKAKYFLLAAGALSSPKLLLASAGKTWPKGCANESDQVGRNLMFHLTEMFVVWPHDKTVDQTASKSIALRDLYYAKGQRLGLVQAMGIKASYGEIVHYLNNIFDRSAIRRARSLRHLTRIPAALAVKVLGNAQIFAGILEDLPYGENKVVLDPAHPDHLTFEYNLAPELLQRRQVFRKLIRKSFKSFRPVFLNYMPELNFGHPCGTLNFGKDARSSVLDVDCKAHGINNLYVADASFMPTSTGVNPSLTIAANALRVADKIQARFL